jgi:hypothetical protein
MELGGAATDRAADQVGVRGLQLARAGDVPGEHAVAEAGRDGLQPLLHPPGHAVELRADQSPRGTCV